MAKATNWTTASESRFPSERDALDFVREQFPIEQPFRAWANFEFIADDGSVNEVDLLVFTDKGFFLIEIKSQPGRLTGDAGAWTFRSSEKSWTMDNPLVLANSKAKKLRQLLQNQKAFRKKGQIPFVEALVFCSAPGLQCELQGNARHRVCLRDRKASDDKPARPGIMAAILRRECSGLDSYARGTHDTPMAKIISQAMDQAGIRPSQRMRKVGDYRLDQLIDEGPGYQDWIGTHSSVETSKRRIRLYLVRSEATEEVRATIQRAATREYQLLEMLQHPGILRALHNTEHELGPALLFEHDPLSLRLDHYLAQQKDRLNIEVRLALVRQITEVIRYAHERKIVHRALCPQSILVTKAEDPIPQLKIFNWQVGYRREGTSEGAWRGVTATSHVDRLVTDSATAYMAPESLNDADFGEHLDVFSLGAVAFHILSGIAPAANAVDLSEKLRNTSGLQISSVMSGATESTSELIRYATHPQVPQRLVDNATDFLQYLDQIEEELTDPDLDTIQNPTLARPKDILPGGYTVVRRIGQGACSVALLVEKDGQSFVAKLANDPDQNPRLQDESEVLQKDEMRHPCIVDYVGSLEVGLYKGFLMRPVFADREKRVIETLGRRLREEGRLHVDMLQRFGENLLDVVSHLEDQGISHKDIKPDNIAVGMVGSGSTLQAVLFDFSLSRAADDNIRAGTPGYLDPLLPLRKRWDLHADRYSAAMTLYELATGTIARWGDGETDPSHLSPGTEITIDVDLFDYGLRTPLLEFFTRAFRRNIKERFDNASDMRRAWTRAFDRIDQDSDHGDASTTENSLVTATFDTPIVELRLGTRAVNALDRVHVADVASLLRTSPATLWRLRGVGKKTCREILDCQKFLRERLGKPPAADAPPPLPDSDTSVDDVGTMSIDLLLNRILPPRNAATTERTLLRSLLMPGTDEHFWPSQTDVAAAYNTTPLFVHSLLKREIERWRKDKAITRLRADLTELIRAQVGVMEVREIPAALLTLRGSTVEEPLRSWQTIAVTRAASELERIADQPRFTVRRVRDKTFLCLARELVDFALRLGTLADRMVSEDGPLVPPVRVLQTLRKEADRRNIAISDARLLKLAVAASETAALSSVQELYPRGMEPSRTLKLSLNSLYGVPELTIAELRRRVASRYPLAADLPGRPDLDVLLKAVGFEFPWSDGAADGKGGWLCRARHGVSVTSGSQSIDRRTTKRGRGEAGEVTPEEADARQFEERLQRSLSEGAFLALTVHPKYYERARSELCRRFPLRLIDFEGMFLDSLQETASGARVKWDLVLQTDTKPKHGDWDKLMMLVGRAMPTVEKQLMNTDKTMLVVYPGLLARYDQMDLLSRLSQKVGRTDGIPGLWLLLPGDKQAMIDGKPVPLIGPGQRTRIPESWLQNLHRGVAEPALDK